MTRERPDQFPQGTPERDAQLPTAAAPDGFAHPAEIAHAVRKQAQKLGFARCGIAPVTTPPRQEAFATWLQNGFAGPMATWLSRHESLRADPRMVLSEARSIVMLATDYSTWPCVADRHAVGAKSSSLSAAGQPAGGATATLGRGHVARYAVGDDYHDLLRERLNRLADWLTVAVPGSTSRGVVDSAPLAERDFGWLAGLGWIGKNTMLISPQAGSFFFLSALLTSVELPADMPLEVDHCGTCTACLDACPTDAFPEPRVLDATKCIATLTIEDRGPVPAELRDGLGSWVFGCDVCQDVCPWNRHAPLVEERAFMARDGEPTLPLADLLTLDPQGFRERFRGSPILRAKRHGLARSAAIALGNTPDPEAAEALAAALADPEPVVRGAAAWALGRWIRKGVSADWARRQLAARLTCETEPEVSAELQEAVRTQEAENDMGPSGPSERPTT